MQEDIPNDIPVRDTSTFSQAEENQLTNIKIPPVRTYSQKPTPERKS